MTNDSEPHQKTLLERLSSLLLREPHDREELVGLLRDAEDRHILDAYSLSMIEGVLQVADLKVRDIMIPRAKMVGVPYNGKLEEYLPVIIESKHSRFPVIGEDKDEIVGILLAKDLIPYLAIEQDKTFNINKFMRPPVFIPESKRLNVLLKEFRMKHNHMAIVVDEYGGVAGLVTIEDVLEQIVGEIEDESDFDEDMHYINKIADNKYTVKAITSIEDFNKHFNTEFSTEDVDTVGGLVMTHFGHLPKKDEEITIEGVNFKILHADHRRIRLLTVSLQQQKLLQTD